MVGPVGCGGRLRPPEPTFRHDANPEHKANRDAAPDILRRQVIDGDRTPAGA